MSILIKGMQMPKADHLLCINIYPNGKVCINLDLDCKQVATAVPVPKHGRLIDADAEIKVWDMGYDGAPHALTTSVLRFLLSHLNGNVPPIIIEAEGE